MLDGMKLCSSSTVEQGGLGLDSRFAGYVLCDLRQDPVPFWVSVSAGGYEAPQPRGESV